VWHGCAHLHHRSTVHHQYTTSTPPVHHQYTTSTPLVHHSTPPVHHKYTTSTPPVHHQYTTLTLALPACSVHMHTGTCASIKYTIAPKYYFYFLLVETDTEHTIFLPSTFFQSTERKENHTKLTSHQRIFRWSWKERRHVLVIE
jgi:hypothetical protein